ncbi:hypothetical protein ACLMJK_000270 [Lecanora helva]
MINANTPQYVLLRVPLQAKLIEVQAVQALKVMTEKLQAARSASAPKRKFTFAKYTAEKQSTVGTSAATNSNCSPPLAVVRSTAASEAQDDYRESNFAKIKETGAHLSGSSASLNLTSLSSKVEIVTEHALRSAVTIARIDRCVVDLSQSVSQARPFSTIAVKDVSRSLLLCGQVSGAAHITNVEDSTIIIWSRQARMHEWLPESIYPQSEGSTGALASNLWDQVDDFNWLKAQHSPNWSLLQPGDVYAIDDEGWEKVAAGEKSHLQLNDLLRAAKVIL